MVLVLFKWIVFDGWLDFFFCFEIILDKFVVVFWMGVKVDIIFNDVFVVNICKKKYVLKYCDFFFKKWFIIKWGFFIKWGFKMIDLFKF